MTNSHFFPSEWMLTNHTTGFVNLQSPAGIGIAGIVFNYDGDIYASDEGRMAADLPLGQSVE